MSYEINIDTERLLPFPYPICRAGATRGSCLNQREYFFADRFEFCLRISSEEDMAREEIDGVSYETAFPHVILKYPFHRISYSYLKPRNAIHFSYSLKVFELLQLSGIIPSEGQFHLPIKLDSELQLLIRKFTYLLNHIMESKIPERLDLAAYEIMTECLMQQLSPKSTSPCNEQILAAASRLRRDFCDEINFEEIAKQCGMSLRTFFRHWQGHFDHSPSQFVQELRIREAARLLRETGIPIASIAVAVKLGDASYLSKVFQKWYEITPGEYRKEQASQALLKQIGKPPIKPETTW